MSDNPKAMKKNTYLFRKQAQYESKPYKKKLYALETENENKMEGNNIGK